MKFFQKRGVAIVVLILAIVASSAWGLHKTPAVSTPEGGEKLDPSLSTAAFTQYVRDDAGVLSDKTEEAIGLYNANWDKMFGSIMAVVTVQSTSDIGETAYDYAMEMKLAPNDAILVIAEQEGSYYLLPSGDFRDLLESLPQSFVASCMADGVEKSDYKGTDHRSLFFSPPCACRGSLRWSVRACILFRRHSCRLRCRQRAPARARRPRR